jgi:hypothetical protein
MAEIVDIVVDAIQLADLAIDIIRNCISYYSSVRDAPTEAKSMRREACSLLAILEDFQIILQKHKDESRVPPNVQSIEEEFKETRILLEDVEKYTTPENIQGRLRLMWPSRRNLVREKISRIQMHKENLKFLLQGAMLFDP